jgi:hypothetical protein
LKKRVGAHVWTKVHYLVNFLNMTPIFEWHMVWCGPKNGHHTNICVKEIEQHAQNMITVLNTIVNIMRRVNITISNMHENLHFDLQYNYSWDFRRNMSKATTTSI